MMERAKQAGIEVMMLTVDSITGGNRERDKRTGFSIPFRLTLAGMMQFAVKPAWAINYLTHEGFKLPQLDGHVDMGGGALSISRYFTEMLDPCLSWDDVAAMVREWGGQFCLKGVMSVDDAKRAVEIGCTGIVLSNHGGRQLGRLLLGIRSARGDRGRGRRPDRRDHGWGRSARYPRVEGPVSRREGGRPGSVLPVPSRRSRSAGRPSAPWT